MMYITAILYKIHMHLRLPADPVGRDAVQGKDGELEVVRSSVGFFAAPPFLCRFAIERGRADGGGRRAEGAQVKLGQVVNGLGEQRHAFVHWAGVP